MTHASEVHARAQEVIDFWFALTMEQQFAKDDDLDKAIRDRFGALRDEVAASQAAGWRETPETLLAAVILLDQFSRNLYRGSGEAFALDPVGQGLSLFAIVKGWAQDYSPEQRAFVYMPLMHAEDRALQDLSVERFGEAGLERNLAFARDHAQVVRRFGRFPSRNAALGRTSTAAEEEYLRQPDAGW